MKNKPSIKDFLSLIRVLQWVKNIFVFVPLIFSRHLFHENYFLISLVGFFSFCIASSIVYIINDILDRELDRKHLRKRFRPIASGKISVPTAIIYASLLLLLLVTMLIVFSVDMRFNIILAIYIVLNFFYSIYLKKIVLVDIFTIATGFMLRVASGGYVIDVDISSWLILTTMFLSLFLAVLKRRSELELSDVADNKKSSTRKVLDDYTLNFIDILVGVTTAGVVISYALYTVAPRTIESFKTENLIYSTPFVVFGIFRYTYLVMKGKKGEYTTEIMLKDKTMLLNALMYVLSVLFILYFKL